MRKRSELKPCPFCGKLPKYDPQSQTVHCTTPECACGDFYFHIEEWNRRAKKKDPNKEMLIRYLFDTQTIFRGSNFYKTTEFVCRGCGAYNEDPYKVKHTKNCEVKQLLN